MNRTASTALIALALAVAGFGCSSHEAEHAAADFAPLTVRMAPVESLTDVPVTEIRGLVQPARQAFVSSRVVGPVIAVRVQASDVVKKDAPLLDIQPSAIDGQVAQANGALAQTRAALSLAERNYRRFESLNADGAASDLELDMARMQYEQAQGAVHQAEGAVQAASSIADEAVVRAPFPARVVDTLVEVGDLAAPGRPLVRVESLSGQQVWLTVREADIGRVATGQELAVRFDSRPDLGSVTATVAEIVPSADPATHSFTVKTSLDGVEVMSGISASAILPGGATSLMAVPATAVHRRGGLELVVVRAADGTARTRAVTTGRSLADGRVEILSGLAADDQVAVDTPGPVADGTPLEVRS